ncbi:MAG: cobalamin-dependent protein [Opitutaceae bacterium]|nr:cobalamin-dependent protein [Opitutaceae bacterium]
MSPPPEQGLPHETERLLATMVEADRTGAALVLDQILATGVPPERIIAEILDPALVKLGRLWGAESVSLTQTFVAAKIAEDVLVRCVPAAGSAAAHHSPVVIGNIEDDFHSLGRRIVGSFLRAAGWEVHDLGNDVLPEQFVDKALEVGAVVVGASAMMQTTALNIRKLRTLIDARGLQGRLKLAVGGAVFNWRPDLVAEVGGDGTAPNAAGVDALLHRLQAEARGAPAP